VGPEAAEEATEERELAALARRLRALAASCQSGGTKGSEGCEGRPGVVYRPQFVPPVGRGQHSRRGGDVGPEGGRRMRLEVEIMYY